MDALTLQTGILFTFLASPYFDVRERTPIPPHVAHLGIWHTDPEIAHRCERALRLHAYAWADQTVAALKPPSGQWPWVDGAKGVQWSEFMQVARDITPPKKQHVDGGWGEYRTCTELWLRSELLAGTPLSQLRELLAEMAETEARWWKAHPLPLPAQGADQLPAPQPGP